MSYSSSSVSENPFLKRERRAALALKMSFPAVDSERLGVRMFLFVRKNKDDKESKEFYYLGRIRHEAGGMLKQFVMPNTDVSAVEIEYKLETPVEKNLYDYLTSENV